MSNRDNFLQVEYDLLIGADGVNSGVRTKLQAQSKDFTGITPRKISDAVSLGTNGNF